MPNLFTFNSKRSVLIKRIGLFLTGLAVFYLLILLILSNVRPLFALTDDRSRDFSLHQLIARNYYSPGWSGQSLRRFREIEKYKDVDILFIGSSHCSRSFDSRTFSRLGVTSFNMGSDSQAPLNSYYLLKKYFDRLNPRLVIFEIYPDILEFDGLEGYYDLLVNLPLSKEIIQMGLAVNNPQAINALITRAAFSITNSIEDIRQNEIRNETYIEGGYLYAEIVHGGDNFGPRRDINVSDTQIKYVHRIIDFVKGRGSEMLMLVAPIPRERREVMTNYDAVSAQIGAIADNHDIRYFDFNESLNLDTRDQFRDYHHMNANGAKVFSYALIDSLLDIAEYYSTLDIQPEQAADIYCGRGIAFVARGQLDKALSDYNKALELMPCYYKAYFNRAILFTQQRDYESAISDFKKAIEINPTSAEGYFSLARIYEVLGRNSDAVFAYSSFIEHAPAERAQYIAPVRERIKILNEIN
jgi:tetratricopeptide (TPR) repeat protein